MAIIVNNGWNADQKKNLQTLLNNYGFTDNNGNKLAVDGVAGPKTQQALSKMNTYQQHLDKPDASTMAWQTQLNDWGYKDAKGMPLKEDGIYGPKTDAATSEFENGFFDGFTGGTNQKKTVTTQTFPAMPKASDSQIQAAITPARTNLTDGWGQSIAYTGMGNQDHSPFTSVAPKPVQTQSSWITPYIKDVTQNTGTTGQNGLSTLDMVARMNKIADKAAAGNTKPGFENAVYKLPGSGQDGGNKNWSDTVLINKAFNEYNRNAGLDKDKFLKLASSNNDTDNTVDPTSHYPQGYNDWTSEQQKKVDPVGTYYIGSGANAVKGNVYAKDVTAPITFDKNNKPSNYGSAGYVHDINDVCAMFDYMDYNTDETLRWSKNSADCSSYVIRVYSALGKNIAMNGTTAADIAQWLDKNNHSVKKEDLQPGDLIFWAQKKADGTYKQPKRYNQISHIAIFAGYDENGIPMMWESSPSGGGVNLRPVLDQGEPLQYARVP